jgi:hypothetical protein
MADLQDLQHPKLTDTEPDVLDTIRGHLTRASKLDWGPVANLPEGALRISTSLDIYGTSYEMRIFRRNVSGGDDQIERIQGVAVDSAENANSAFYAYTAGNGVAYISSGSLTLHNGSTYYF